MYRKLAGNVVCSRYILTKSSSAACRQIRYFKAEAPAPPPPEQLSEIMSPFREYSPDGGFAWSSRHGKITMSYMTLDEYVWKDVNKWQNKIAIVCGITGRSYTYGKLRDHCAAVAYRLRNNFNLKPRDVVAISMPNVPEYAIVALGALEAGLTLTTINPIYTPEEQARQLAMTDAKMIFSLFGNTETVFKACALNKTSIPVVGIRTNSQENLPDGVVNFAELMDLKNVQFNQNRPETITSKDICVLPFSSGTSGMPKGVMLTHSNLTCSLQMHNNGNPYHPLSLPTTNDFQDVFPCVLPFFHIFGLSFVLMSKLQLGSKLVTLPRFDPETYLSAIAEHKATFLALVPPIFQFLTNDDRCTAQHMTHVRTVFNGAAPVGSELVDRFHSTKGHNVEYLQGYGLTETSPSAFAAHRLYINHNSIGWPCASTRAKIVSVDDPLNRGLEANVSGELLLQGPTVMRGYLNNPTETQKVITEDGWFRTGDIGSYDNNGDFYITDRAKELIKVQGNQVAPAELEEMLRAHPKVLDVAVVGVKHDKLGEAPKAFIVRRDESVTGIEIQEFITARCSKYKRLVGGVQFIDAIPKNQTGKILRRELKRLYEQ